MSPKWLSPYTTVTATMAMVALTFILMFLPGEITRSEELRMMTRFWGLALLAGFVWCLASLIWTHSQITSEDTDQAGVQRYREVRAGLILWCFVYPILASFVFLLSTLNQWGI